jgi:imidazole glycerol-phosphate synthase subunit HisH
VIGIIDYGAGNLASVKHACERVGEDAELFSDSSLAGNYNRLILPGVGSFRMAIERLNESCWPKAIRQHIEIGKPLLGICLGMQLLFDESDEHGPSSGLSIIPGKVKLIQPSSPHRIPHVGWNRLFPKRTHPVMHGVKDHIDFYFVHSYQCIPESEENILATCDHGGRFVASVTKGCVVGMQFHPEKSQPAGLRLLQNFADWDGLC